MDHPEDIDVGKLSDEIKALGRALDSLQDERARTRDELAALTDQVDLLVAMLQPKAVVGF